MWFKHNIQDLIYRFTLVFVHFKGPFCVPRTWSAIPTVELEQQVPPVPNSSGASEPIKTLPIFKPRYLVIRDSGSMA